MLKCIEKILKRGKRKLRHKTDNTPWSKFYPMASAKPKNDTYKDYIRESHDKRISKSMHKDNRGPRVQPC